MQKGQQTDDRKRKKGRKVKGHDERCINSRATWTSHVHVPTLFHIASSLLFLVCYVTATSASSSGPDRTSMEQQSPILYLTSTGAINMTQVATTYGHEAAMLRIEGAHCRHSERFAETYEAVANEFPDIPFYSTTKTQIVLGKMSYSANVLSTPSVFLFVGKKYVQMDGTKTRRNLVKFLAKYANVTQIIKDNSMDNNNHDNDAKTLQDAATLDDDEDCSRTSTCSRSDVGDVENIVSGSNHENANDIGGTPWGMMSSLPNPHRFLHGGSDVVLSAGCVLMIIYHYLVQRTLELQQPQQQNNQRLAPAGRVGNVVDGDTREPPHVRAEDGVGRFAICIFMCSITVLNLATCNQ